MKRNLIIRIGFGLFLFAIGFLVGAGLSKTVRQLTGKHEKAVILSSFETKKHYFC